jgi:hypothetical protein
MHSNKLILETVDEVDIGEMICFVAVSDETDIDDRRTLQKICNVLRNVFSVHRFHSSFVHFMCYVYMFFQLFLSVLVLHHLQFSHAASVHQCIHGNF